MLDFPPALLALICCVIVSPCRSYSVLLTLSSNWPKLVLVTVFSVCSHLNIHLSSAPSSRYSSTDRPEMLKMSNKYSLNDLDFNFEKFLSM